MNAKSILTRGASGLAYVSLTSELENIASGIDDELKEVMREQAEKIADTARQLCPGPGSSGRLRDSIEVYEYERPGKSGFRIRAGAKDDNGVPYAHMVEYGSVHSPEGNRENTQPFMLPAKEAHEAETIKAMNDKIEELAS
jgi:HK97 gp10 family phage protein